MLAHYHPHPRGWGECSEIDGSVDGESLSSGGLECLASGGDPAPWGGRVTDDEDLNQGAQPSKRAQRRALKLHEAFKYELQVVDQSVEGGLTKVEAYLAAGRLGSDPFGKASTEQLRDFARAITAASRLTGKMIPAPVNASGVVLGWACSSCWRVDIGTGWRVDSRRAEVYLLGLFHVAGLPQKADTSTG